MRNQGLALKSTHFALALALTLLLPSVRAHATDCTAQGFLFEGEIITRDRVQGEIKVSQEFEALVNSWNVNDPIYSNLLLRTKDEKTKLIGKPVQVYVQVAKQIAGPFNLEPAFEVIPGQSRARIQDLRFRKIIDSARERNSGKIELSVRSGDEILCVHIMTVRGGD